ncbi:hypothetical protein [Psychrobacter sp. 16-MNA-CIBAN-0192]|uniref:hypothetical protein n=1 Tax=Psychrobacter sp. 16-MNA-CIBAN-0192 TaxID=3140448 RepID=UPI00332D77EB
MAVREAASFYELSTITIHSWQQNLTPNPDDYMYEQAQRLGYSKSGIESVLNRLGIS